MKLKRIALAIVLTFLTTGIGSNVQADGVWMPGAWLLGDDWNADSNDFADLGGGIYQNTLSGLVAGDRYAFKIIEDADNDNIGDWANDKIVPAGNNAVVYADAGGNVTIDYDSNDERYLVSSFQTANSWFAVGTFQDESGAAGDWDNMAAATEMTDIGGGIYEFVTPVIAAGTYEWKATTNGWDFQVGDEGVNENGTTQVFTLNGSNYARMIMNSNTQSITLTVVPEPGTIGLMAFAGVLGIIRRRR